MDSLNILGKIEYISPIIASILSLWFISYFNIIEYINFIPKDNKFDVCLALYLTITQIMINLLNKYLQNKINKNLSEIRVIFYNDKNNKNINFEPTVCFNKETGVGQVKCIIEMNGNTKILNSTRLVISFPDWIEVQPDLKECEIKRFDNCSSIYINLNKFSIDKDSENFKVDFNIPMLINDVTGCREIKIKCKFEFTNRSKVNILSLKKYMSNSFKLISENV